MCYCCSYLQPRASYCVVYVCVMPGLEGCNSCCCGVVCWKWLGHAKWGDVSTSWHGNAGYD